MPEFRVDDFVLGLFRTAGMRNRTFVECGANDGRYSHTRLFEAKLGWCGGCIEASPPNFKRLQRSVTPCIPGRGAAPQRHDPHLPTHAPPLRSFGPRLDALACGMGPSAEVTDSNVTAMAVRELLPSVLPARLDWFVLDVLRAPKWRYYATHGNACTRVCGLSKPQV